MTAFRFSLERVLQWRRTALALEEARFKQQAALVGGIDRARAELDAEGVRAENAVRERRWVDGRELAALAGFRRHAGVRRAELAAARARAVRELGAREAVLLEARRRVRLLERLRERRLGEWKAEADRELEQLAAESHLARRAAGRG